MGNVQVYLPPDLPLTIDAAIRLASGYKIESDFPLRIAGEEPGYVAPTLHGNGSLNGGGKLLYIRTVAGNIEIRKLDAATLEKLRQQQDAPSSHRQQIRRAPERREREHERD